MISMTSVLDIWVHTQELMIQESDKQASMTILELEVDA